MKKVTDTLIVDDDEIACFIYSTMLEDMELDQRVHSISDSTKALEYLQQKCSKGAVETDTECILVILDARMPILDGFEVLEELEKCPVVNRERIYVVLLTTILTNSVVQKASKYKLQGAYYKPLTKQLVRDHRQYPWLLRLAKGSLFR